MKKFICLVLILGIFILSSNLSYAVTVPSNTSIFIKPTKTITSKHLDIGEIPATIQNDVIIDNITVFKAGSKATLDIGDIEKARCWGNPGRLTISNGWVYDTNGNKQKILFSKTYHGREKTWPKVLGVVSIFFLWPLVFFGFVHGGQAEVLSTVEIEAFLASQYEFIQK